MTEEERHIFFNENFNIFDRELEKRRRKWQLHAVPSLDFCDIKQIILFHIFKKIHLYDSKKAPLPNWTNSVISAQISNLLRNNYYNMVEPCKRCACAQPDNGCELYSERGSNCPIFRHWEKNKKEAFNIRLPLPQESHVNEIYNLPSKEHDFEKAESRMHEEMRKMLKKHEWIVYEMLYVFHMTDAQIAKKMKWISSEGRKPGYGNLARLKKIFIKKARDINENIDLF